MEEDEIERNGRHIRELLLEGARNALQASRYDREAAKLRYETAAMRHAQAERRQATERSFPSYLHVIRGGRG